MLQETIHSGDALHGQPSDITRRSRDICVLQSFTQSNELPTSVKARGHSLKINGAHQPSGFWIGAHGNNSKNICGHLASIACKKEHQRMSTLDAYVRVRGLHESRLQHSVVSVQSNGFLHYERISMPLEKLMQHWLCLWVSQHFGPLEVENLTNSKSPQILLRYPDAAFDLFDDMNLKMLVIPARLTIAPQITLNVAIIKPKTVTEIERFEIRYLAVPCKY